MERKKKRKQSRYRDVFVLPSNGANAQKQSSVLFILATVPSLIRLAIYEL